MDKDEVNTLLSEIKKGNEVAFESLTVKYDPLLKSVASSFAVTARGEGLGEIYADLCQELTYVLFRAAKTYDTEQDQVTFGKYAKRCLNNCAISFLRKARSAAKRERKVRNTLGKEQKPTGLFSGISKENGESTLNAAKTILSPYEYTIFIKYVEGESVSEIAKEVGKDAKSVSNALFRCRAKVKRLIKPE